MPVTINSNLASLNAQRRLQESTSALTSGYQRLASGLRISKASDDAAGLAISSGLHTDARVYEQAKRNIGDAISLTNIAEGAVQQLTNIVTRIRELSEQSANGVLGRSQRGALNQEANALVNEYNRILEETSFNNLKLIDGSLSSLSIQAGYGQNGALQVSVGQSLLRNIGTGIFGTAAVTALAVGGSAYQAKDMNRDGNVDVMTVSGDGFQILLGNGDGTLKAPSLFYTGDGGNALTFLDLADVNNDGFEDLLGGDFANNGAAVFLGNGNGTFKVGLTYQTGDTAQAIIAADVNGDGARDIITGGNNGITSILLNNGNGTFKAAKTFSPAGLVQYGIRAADLNSDRLMDLVIADASGVRTYMGDGQGNFTAALTFSAIAPLSYALVKDVDNDGAMDILAAPVAGSTAFAVFRGNGNGGFSAPVSYGPAMTNFTALEMGDINGDGFLDVVASDYAPSGSLSVFLGNGNGSFKAHTTSYSAPSSIFNPIVADFNNDGVVDIAAGQGGGSNFELRLAATTTTARLQAMNLNSQEAALEALTTTAEALRRVTSEMGALGAVQSRLGVDFNNLSQARENLLSSASRITDVDVASESSTLARNQILQQAGVAILAQANQQPQLALSLLNGF